MLYNDTLCMRRPYCTNTHICILSRKSDIRSFLCIYVCLLAKKCYIGAWQKNSPKVIHTRPLTECPREAPPLEPHQTTCCHCTVPLDCSSPDGYITNHYSASWWGGINKCVACSYTHDQQVDKYTNQFSMMQKQKTKKQKGDQKNAWYMVINMTNHVH